MVHTVRAAARRLWPLAALLAAALAADLESADGLVVPGRWWMLPGALLALGLALLAAQWPVGAGLGFGVVLIVWSVVLRLAGAEVVTALGRLYAVEVVAAMAIIVLVTRRTGAAAVGVIAWLLAALAAADALRIELPASSGPALIPDVLVPGGLLLCLGVLGGRYLRARDRDQERTTRDAVAAAQQRERLSLARELHDVVAHHVGVIVVQAQAAQVVANADPDAAQRVLPLVEKSGGEALQAMRRLVAALREADEPTPAALPTTDLAADLRAVTAVQENTGTPVRLSLELAEPVPPEVAGSVLRLVQESVTNAWRHAIGASQIGVRVSTGHGRVCVQVADDGTGTAPGPRGGGFGLVGMRERTQLLGGRFAAGPARGGGWQVDADLPLREPGR